MKVKLSLLNIYLKKNTDIYDKKLKQKQKDLYEQVQKYTSVQKNLDSLNRKKVILEKKIIGKDYEINSFEVKSKGCSNLLNKKQSNKMPEKFSKDLEKMEDLKITEGERENKSLINKIHFFLEESGRFIFFGRVWNH